MNEPTFDPRHENILNQVHEDMEVYDVNGNHIGEVEYVFLGSLSEEDERFGTGPATADDIGLPHDDPFLVDFAFGGGVSPSDSAEEDLVRDRLIRDGFIRLDAEGLFARDRYITSDQVASVEGDRVLLRVSRGDLIDTRGEL